MLVIDLFSGLGGWSAAFKDRGHEVFTIDIDPRFEPDLVADILTVEPEDLPPNPDVVLASPPCTDFTKDSMPWYDNEPPSMELVNYTLCLIEDLKPRWWVLENVRGSVKYIEPILGEPKRVGAQYLWGHFPIFDPAPTRYKWHIPPGADRAALRAMIPYNISYALCTAIEREIGNDMEGG